MSKNVGLDAHKKEERIIPAEVQARLDKGNGKERIWT